MRYQQEQEKFQLSRFLYERSIVQSNNHKEEVQRKLCQYLSCVGISLQRHVKIGGYSYYYNNNNQQQSKKAGILGLDVCGNGRFVLSGCQNGSIHVHDISLAGSQYKLQMGMDKTYYPPIASTSNCGSPIKSVEWYQKHDTGAFVSTQLAGYVSLWDTNAFKAVVQLPIPNQLMHSSYCPSTITCAVVLHPEQTIQLWNVAQGTTTHTLPTSTVSAMPTCVLWHPTQPHYLFSGDVAGNVHLWDVRKPKSFLYNLCQYHSPHAGEPITHLTTTSNGHSLLTTSSASNTITHWNLSQITMTATTNHNHTTIKPYNTRYVCPNNGGRIQNISILEDTTVWITQDEELHGYSLEKGSLPQNSLQGHLDTITSLVTTTGTYQILTGSKDGMILSWGYTHPATKQQTSHDYWNLQQQQQQQYNHPQLQNHDDDYDCWDL